MPNDARSETVDEMRRAMVDEVRLVQVADDAPAMRDLLRMVLQDRGYAVAGATDGANILAFLGKSFDLDAMLELISDLAARRGLRFSRPPCP